MSNKNGSRVWLSVALGTALAAFALRVLGGDLGGGYFDGACQLGELIAGVTAVKGRDAAVAAMTFLLEGLTIPK